MLKQRLLKLIFKSELGVHKQPNRACNICLPVFILGIYTSQALLVCQIHHLSPIFP